MLMSSSEKLLKKYIDKWDLGKNIKSREMEAISRRLSLRNSAHKRSEIRVRGQVVPVAKVIRYRKRHSRVLRNEVAGIRSPTPPGVEIYSPPASPITTPRMMRLPEEIIKCIRDYIPGAFEARIWTSVGDLEDIETQQKSVDTIDFIDELFSARTLFINEDVQNGQRMLIRAEKRLNEVISDQDYWMTTDLFRCIFFFAGKRQLDLIMPTLEKGWATALRMLGPKHPIALIWGFTYSYLSEADSDMILPAIRSAYASAVDGFKYALGPLHMSVIESRSLYITHVLFYHDREKSLSELREILHGCEENFRGPEDLRSLEALLHLADALTRSREAPCQEFLDVAAEILEKTKRRGFPLRWLPFYQGEAHYFIGVGQMKVGKVESGESHLSKAININVAAFGAQDVGLQRFQLELESWLRRWGRTEAADLVGRKRRAALQLIEP